MATIGPDGVEQWTIDLARRWEVASQITDLTERNKKLIGLLNLSHHLQDRMANPELAELHQTLSQKFADLTKAEQVTISQDQKPPLAAPSP